MKYQLPDKITGRLQIGYAEFVAADGVIEIETPGEADLQLMAMVGATEVKPEPKKKAASKADDKGGDK